jgi:hypothetical protein
MAAAPSEIWLDTAAVRRPPSVMVLRPAIFSIVVSGRGPSSSVTAPKGRISRAKRPSAVARAARMWLSYAKASMSSRLMFHFSAIISADRNWLTRPAP